MSNDSRTIALQQRRANAITIGLVGFSVGCISAHLYPSDSFWIGAAREFAVAVGAGLAMGLLLRLFSSSRFSSK